MRWFPSRPKTSTKQPPPSDRTIVVQLLKGAGDKAALKINQDDVTWENLEGRLNDIFKTRAEKVMFVKADPDLTFDEVAQVIDIAHSAGVDKVGLITAKIEAGQLGVPRKQETRFGQYSSSWTGGKSRSDIPAFRRNPNHPNGE